MMICYVEPTDFSGSHFIGYVIFYGSSGSPGKKNLGTTHLSCFIYIFIYKLIFFISRWHNLLNHSYFDFFWIVSGKIVSGKNQ
jgi:hypothetical protein